MNELLDKLSFHASSIIEDFGGTPPKFRCIVLLDDFSASGSSYYSTNEDGTRTGKVAKFLRALCDDTNPLHKLCDPSGVDLVILIYMATEDAINHLRSSVARDSIPGVNSFNVETVQLVPVKIKIQRGGSAEIAKVIEKYYDDSVFDVHMQKGKTIDARYGYADCGLPIVLHHNTPNNSVAILWFYEHCSPRGLFPRVQGHREMS